MRLLFKRQLKDIRYRLRASAIRIGYHSTPSFLIIGAQKCGTVALYNYLAHHPQILKPSIKEIGYFHNDENYKEGVCWYHIHFPLPHKFRKQMITFEATPEYLYYPATAERIFTYDPLIKLIVLLRNPIERAFSAWNMYCKLIKNPNIRRKLPPSLSFFQEFDQMVRDEIDKIARCDADPEPSYVRRGLYSVQLKRYLRLFKNDQILIIESQSLKQDTATVLGKITRFLAIQEYDWHKTEFPLYHRGEYTSRISAQTRSLLRDFYKPYNEKLFELLGQDFCWQ